MSETVRVGLFGLGYWGSKYLRLLQEVRGIELTFVVDADRRRLQQLGMGSQIGRYHEPLKALAKEKCEAAVVVTPASTHRKLVGQCLEKSLDVLVEKPLALSLADSIHLARLARRAGRVLFPGHVYAHNDGVRLMAKLVHESDFGELRYVSCMRTGLGPIRGDTNALWDLVPHDLTVLSALGLSRPKTVVAVGGAFLQPKIEDVAFATLMFPGGRLANIQASWLDPYKTRRVTAVGSRKMVTFDDGALEDRVKIYERGVDLVPSATFGDFKAQIRSGDVHIPFVEHREPLRNLVEAFVRARHNPREASAELGRALEIVASLEAMHKSMKSGGNRVDVDWSQLGEFSGGG